MVLQGQRHAAVAPGQPLIAPGCAKDGGEEPEVAGIYIIGPDGQPFRIGWALANEFSDHVIEKVNYLWLAHSKLRPASFGPEILVGALPADLRGTSRIHRGGRVLWEKPFLSGGRTCRTLTHANLEHHHFKYGIFCQPGDLHVHVRHDPPIPGRGQDQDRSGRRVRDRGPPFGLPLKNPLAFAPKETSPTLVKAL